jgi:Adenylosuccinate synthetase (EC 6.3.4.4)
MPVSIVIGSQWGDEGKGKIVDLLSPDVDIVARYQGGANAGHTIVWDEEGETEEFVLHLVPSGIFHEGVTCVIGNGVVLDPKAVLEEIEKIKSLGIDVEGRLKISHNAHLIMPYHKAIEAAQEEERASASDDDEIGTTGRGIGPAYTDKFARTGIRVVDLLDEEVLRRKLRRSIEEKNAILRDVYDVEALDVDRIVEEYVEFDQKIDDYVTDTSAYLARSSTMGPACWPKGRRDRSSTLTLAATRTLPPATPRPAGAALGSASRPPKLTAYWASRRRIARVSATDPSPRSLRERWGRPCERRAANSGPRRAAPDDVAGSTSWP